MAGPFEQGQMPGMAGANAGMEVFADLAAQQGAAPVAPVGPPPLHPLLARLFGGLPQELLQMMVENPEQAIEYMAAQGIEPPPVNNDGTPVVPASPAMIQMPENPMQGHAPGGNIPMTAEQAATTAAPAATPEAVAAAGKPQIQGPLQEVTGGKVGWEGFTGGPAAVAGPPRGMAGEPVAAVNGAPTTDTVDWAALMSGVEMPQAPQVQTPPAAGAPQARNVPTDAMAGAAAGQTGQRMAPDQLARLLQGMM